MFSCPATDDFFRSRIDHRLTCVIRWPCWLHACPGSRSRPKWRKSSRARPRWGETPTWQFFSGQAYFEHHRPCDATTLVKFRQLLGEEGVEELLAQTINVAVDLKLIKPQELSRVIIDSTVLGFPQFPGRFA